MTEGERVSRNVPIVEGARIPVSNRSIPPCRSSSMSSIESAPATIPVTSAGTFRCAFAPPFYGRVRLSATSSDRPQRCASVTTGANPAHDTKFGSSNTADTSPGA